MFGLDPPRGPAANLYGATGPDGSEIKVYPSDYIYRSGKGVCLRELVQGTPAMRRTHPRLLTGLRGTTVFGGAYADDLTLTASNRADLQALADICNDWFEAHDIEVNATKSVHLSHDPATNRPTLGDPIRVGSSTGRAPVLRLQSPKEPLRVLGMYTVPDGDHDPMFQMCKDLAARQAKVLRSRAVTDKIALFVVRAAMMPALTHKMQGHAFTHQQIDQIARPLMHALKHACNLPTSFPSSFMHHRLAGKVPRLERVHTANNLTLLVRAMNAPTPLGEITLARIAATEHEMSFPGPMLDIPWHVQTEHLTKAGGRGRRSLIPALAMALHERGATIGTPGHTPQWTAAHALPTPPQWLFGLFRRQMPGKDMRMAYNRACIWASDTVRYNERLRTIGLQPQPPGCRPNFIWMISRRIAEANATHAEANGPPSADLGDWARLRAALQPAGRQPSDAAHQPEPPLCIPFTQPELMRAYGHDHPPTDADAKWVVHTDGSVVQRDGRAMGAFAATFTQGPDTPADLRGRVLELPLSSTRMEAMAIAAAIAITPPSVPLEIRTDSQSASHMMSHVSAPITTRELTNSPDAFLWLHFRNWVRAREAPVTTIWVRGHSGVAGNEEADRLATSAHDDPSVTRWTTQMPPPHGTPIWMLHDGRVIPRRPRRLLREQDEAITATHLVAQVNAVPDRPTQTPGQVALILQMLQWTRRPDEGTEQRKRWKTTNSRDAHIRAFGYKQLMGFLPTLQRQQAWYPEVYNRPELVRCAKCGHTPETQDHVYQCADHAAVEAQFIESYRALLPMSNPPVDPPNPRRLGSFALLDGLHGRVDPRWADAIPGLQQRRYTRQGWVTDSAKTVTKWLLRAALSAWYTAAWLPRCERTIEQEQSEGLRQATKIRWMRAARRGTPRSQPSPTHNPPRSFPQTAPERLAAHHRSLFRLMHGTDRR